MSSSSYIGFARILPEICPNIAQIFARIRHIGKSLGAQFPFAPLPPVSNAYRHIGNCEETNTYELTSFAINNAHAFYFPCYGAEVGWNYH